MNNKTSTKVVNTQSNNKEAEKMAATNKMGTAPVGKLMISVGLPIVLSMMLQAVYNIVDSAFLSNMKEAGEQALTALGLAFPVQLLMIAVAIGTGVGTNALLAKCLGQKNIEKANQVAGNAIFLGIIITIVFIIFGFVGVPMYVNSQSAGGAISETSLLMAIDYLQICCCLSIGIIFFSIFEKMLQATGRSLYSTIGQITGAVVNIVFDPILIYGWLGFPEMGVKGAAYATVLGQIVSAVMVLIFHIKKNVEIDKKLSYMKPSLSIIKEIYVIGLPAIISQALLTAMTYGLNIILGKIPEIGENAVTVYGLYCKIQQLIIFAAVGLRDAITPIVSYNHGMRNKKRIKAGINYGLLYTAILMLLGLIVIELFAEPLTRFFSLSDTTFDLCVSCMRIISLAFIFAGLNIAFQGIFQALACGIESLIISIGRQVLFILPVAWIFVHYFITGPANANLVWWTFMIGETITLILAVLMYVRVLHKKINAIEA
jgi:putative MATE family efflux protein